MTIQYYLNRFGIPQALAAALTSFVWTVLSVGAAYLAMRLDLVGTDEALAIAMALRVLVSAVFAYLKQGDPRPVEQAPSFSEAPELG